MCTLQVTVPPPPLPDPLHWSTEVTSWSEGVVVVVQGSAAFAAPWHAVTVTIELVTPVTRSRLLITVTSHATAWPPTLSVPLHWLTATGAVAAAVTIAGWATVSSVGVAAAVIAGSTALPTVALLATSSAVATCGPLMAPSSGRVRAADVGAVETAAGRVTTAGSSPVAVGGAFETTGWVMVGVGVCGAVAMALAASGTGRTWGETP
jgi:hypothetical protein